MSNELTQGKMKYRRNCKSLKLFCTKDLLGREVVWKGHGYRIMVFEGGLIEIVTFTEFLPCMLKLRYSHDR